MKNVRVEIGFQPFVRVRYTRVMPGRASEEVDWNEAIPVSDSLKIDVELWQDGEFRVANVMDGSRMVLRVDDAATLALVRMAIDRARKLADRFTVRAGKRVWRRQGRG